MPRNPAPNVHPRDPVLATLKGFLDWVHRRLDTEIPQLLTATKAWNPGSVADAASTSTAVDVPGANMGDVVMVGHSKALDAGVWLAGAVTEYGVVTVTLANLSGGAFNLPSGTLRVCVWRYTT